MRSIGAAEAGQGGGSRTRLAFSAGFVLLLLLAVAWPAPVIWMNDRSVGAELAVDERSFLGREAPSWDILFWSIAGLYTIALLHGRVSQAAEGFRLFTRDLKQTPGALRAGASRLPPGRSLALCVAAVAVVMFVWIALDGPLLDVAENLRTDLSRASIRLLNRLGGGMNPVMIIGFFLIGGIVFLVRRWWLLAISMTVAGLFAGLLVQIVKFTVDRSRPELWLGPFHFSNSSSSSFPSGHTIGAFALAAAVVAGSRSWPLRFTALVLATAIGGSRVIAFRHWPSDVVASAMIGSLCGWLCGSALTRLGIMVEGDSENPTRSGEHAAAVEGLTSPALHASRSANETDTRREQPASSIVTP